MTYWRQFDKFFISLVQRLPDSLHPVMVFITNMGAPLSTFSILIIMMAVTYFKKSKQILIAEAYLLAALPLAGLLKIITMRSRPESIYVENMRFKTYSFPSGHAYGSFLVFGFLAYLAFKYLPAPLSWLTSAVLGLLILAVGVSRVYLGAHFPTDVIGGWLLGAAVLFLVIRYAL